MKPLPEQPLVSIVMPAYNAEKYIQSAIDSILTQTYPNLELLIANDASTDQTKSIVDGIGDNRVRTFHNSKNLGYLKTCNKLFEKCTGDLITFQDADDLSSPERIKIQVEAFRNDKGLGACTCNYELVNKRDKTIKTRRWDLDFERFKNDADYNPLFCGATIMIRKEVFEEVGGYHDFFDRLGAEDFEWLFRIARQFKIKHLQEVLYSYRIHDSAVKTTNTDRKKHYIHELVKFIRNEQITKDINVLDPEHENLLNAKIKALDEPYRKDTSLVEKQHSLALLNQEKHLEGLLLSSKILVKNPLQGNNYYHLLFSLYKSLRIIAKL